MTAWEQWAWTMVCEAPSAPRRDVRLETLREIAVIARKTGAPGLALAAGKAAMQMTIGGEQHG